MRFLVPRRRRGDVQVRFTKRISYLGRPTLTFYPSLLPLPFSLFLSPPSLSAPSPSNSNQLWMAKWWTEVSAPGGTLVAFHLFYLLISDRNSPRPRLKTPLTCGPSSDHAKRHRQIPPPWTDNPAGRPPDSAAMHVHVCTPSPSPSHSPGPSITCPYRDEN